MKKTILYVGGFEFPDKNAAAQRVMANAEIFAGLGYDTVFLGIDKSLKFSDVDHVVKNIFNGHVCNSGPYPKSSKEWIKYLSDISVFKQVIEELERVDAVICYNYPAAAFYKIIRYCQQRKIKVIADSTEWYSSYEGSLAFKIIKYLDNAFRIKIMNRITDGLIVSSGFLNRYYKRDNKAVIPTLLSRKNDLPPYYGDSEVTKLIYGGVPFRLGTRLNDRSSAKDRLDKAIELLFEMHKRDVNFCFDIYGVTKEQYLEVLPDDASMLEALSKKVFFHGRCAASELKEIIRHADFSILLRDVNVTSMAGFPTKFTESVNCGIPVITTKTSDLPQYLDEGVNGFFIGDGDGEYDVDKLEKILSMYKSEINEMKRKCFESGTFNLDRWSSEAAKILK